MLQYLLNILVQIKPLYIDLPKTRLAVVDFQINLLAIFLLWQLVEPLALIPCQLLVEMATHYLEKMKISKYYI